MPPTLDRANTPGDLLHELVRAGLPELLAAVHEQERSLPRFVIDELQRFVACGDPANGFAWLRCEHCDHHRLVPFSCKGRGFCPSCGGRRMAERAARWVDGLLPRTAVRQWVITVPWTRRWLLARRHDLACGVIGQALAEVFAWYRRRARRRGHHDAQFGAIVVIQRFGSALNLNVHFHVLVPDGYFATDPKTGRVRFFRDQGPSTTDVEAIVVRVAQRVERWLAGQGFGPEDDTAADEDPDDALSVIQGASVQGQLALGKRGGFRARRIQTLAGRPYTLPPRCAGCDGYTVHAGVVVGARNRQGLERLARYIARPPLAKSRLEQRPDGSVSLTLKTPWSDGTRELRFSRLELMERLAALVPPPNANQVLYHGVFAARSKLRTAVVSKPRARKPRLLGSKLVRHDEASEESRWVPWAWLLKRVFDVDGWACPSCGQRMRLQAVVKGPPASERILRGLTAACRGPPDFVAS